jgi:hypothetical protein
MPRSLSEACSGLVAARDVSVFDRPCRSGVAGA